MEQAAHGRSLVRVERREDLQHLAAVPRSESLCSRARGDAVERRPCGRLVRDVAVVERGRQVLVLRPGPARLRQEARQPRRPCVRLRLELETVVADVDELGNTDDALGVLACPPADARDERVAGVQSPQLLLGLRRDARVLGTGDDRRERAVDVEQDRRALRFRRETGKRLRATRQRIATRVMYAGFPHLGS